MDHLSLVGIVPWEYYSHLKRLRGIEGRKGYCECFMIPAEQMRIVKKLEDE